MRKVVIVPGLALVALLAGCAHHGGHGRGPDELSVARQAPLTIPPDFSLRPPQPGSPRANEANPSREALAAMFGGPVRRSPGEAATVDAAGGASADQGVRSSVGDPQTNVVDKGSTTRDIVAAPEGDGQSARARAQ